MVTIFTKKLHGTWSTGRRYIYRLCNLSILPLNDFEKNNCGINYFDFVFQKTELKGFCVLGVVDVL